MCPPNPPSLRLSRYVLFVCPTKPLGRSSELSTSLDHNHHVSFNSIQSLPLQNLGKITVVANCARDFPKDTYDPYALVPDLGTQVLLGYKGLSLETPNVSTIAAPRNGRFFSADTNKADEPSKAEEAETVDVPPSTTEKLLVLGGNGFVGSHVCKEALNHGLSVASLSRSGKSSIQESWANKVNWHQGNLLSDDSWTEALNGVTSVVSCVGGFGSNSYMYKINGTANINAIRAAAEQGVKRFVYISAADFGVVNYLLQGYYEGKRGAETELVTKFTYGGVILRPGFIYGTRRVGSMKLPLGVIGSPLEMVLQHAKPLNQVPLVGPLFTTPVNVTAVAKVAVRAATDHVFPPGIIDVYGILRYSQQKSV